MTYEQNIKKQRTHVCLVSLVMLARLTAWNNKKPRNKALASPVRKIYIFVQWKMQVEGFFFFFNSKQVRLIHVPKEHKIYYNSPRSFNYKA